MITEGCRTMTGVDLIIAPSKSFDFCCRKIEPELPKTTLLLQKSNILMFTEWYGNTGVSHPLHHSGKSV